MAADVFHQNSVFDDDHTSFRGGERHPWLPFDGIPYLRRCLSDDFNVIKDGKTFLITVISSLYGYDAVSRNPQNGVGSDRSRINLWIVLGVQPRAAIE